LSLIFNFLARVQHASAPDLGTSDGCEKQTQQRAAISVYFRRDLLDRWSKKAL
jgi:hypothetical protein